MYYSTSCLCLGVHSKMVTCNLVPRGFIHFILELPLPFFEIIFCILLTTIKACIPPIHHNSYLTTLENDNCALLL